MQDCVPIEFDAPRAFVGDAQSVLFFAHHGTHRMRCYVTRKTLVAYFGASGGADDGQGCLCAFDAHLDEIHAIARQLIHDRVVAGGGGDAVVVTARDVYRAIVDHHAGGPGGACASVSRHG